MSVYSVQWIVELCRLKLGLTVHYKDVLILAQLGNRWVNKYILNTFLNICIT